MSTVASYLANGGADYIASPDYERRRIALAEMMAAGRISFADISTALGLPLAVVCELFNRWQVEKAAANAVRH